MLHRFLVCFTVFWLCLLLLLSICHKQTCIPLRWKWPLRLFVFVVVIFWSSFYSPFPSLPLAICAADFFLWFCQLLASFASPAARYAPSPSPSAECFISLYLNADMLPHNEEALYVPGPSLSKKTFVFYSTSLYALKFSNVPQWKQMMNAHLPLFSRRLP